MGLNELEKQLARDLELINYPAQPWRPSADEDPVLDVAIIGGGMAGLTAAFALMKQGICNIQVFDKNPEGQEGPWTTYARMRTLRSQKTLMGPALDVPSLTFPAWYEATHGHQAWLNLKKPSRQEWMDYLIWFRHVLHLPIKNQYELIAISPKSNGLIELTFMHEGRMMCLFSRKVVLATGRGGFGGNYIPSDMQNIPKTFYAHTNEWIDFDKLKGKRVGVIGSGASAYDASAVALEHGAASVDMLVRRPQVPRINKLASITYMGFSQGFYHLSDRWRWQFFAYAFSQGHSPPDEAIERVRKYSNFHLHVNFLIRQISLKEQGLTIQSEEGILQCDYLILGTGFHIHGYKQPEIQSLMDHILLWKDRMPIEGGEADESLGAFPYLGPGFEFMEKIPGTAPYLKQIYCFNYGATLSHGLLSSDIPGISIGATRLAEHIAADFFVNECENYFHKLEEYE